MDVRHHPEHDLYHRDAALVATCRRAVVAWKEEGETILAPDGVTWTPRDARAFVEGVAALFRAYNLALWQTFSYCRNCGGGCCVTGASQVTTFDALALALLDEPFPELAPRAAEGDCIYLGPQGCRWPGAWRPIKCWAFYCLGSGDWEIDAEDARYTRITHKLQEIVQQRLPGYLQKWDAGADRTLHQFLADPIAFADALGAALCEIFVAPFASAYPLVTEQPRAAGASDALGREGPPAIEQAMTFIAEAVEALWQRPASAATDADEQFLADLERLEGIVAQRPPDAQRALQTLSDRYAGDNERAKEGGGADPLREQMDLILQKLLRDPELPAHSR